MAAQVIQTISLLALSYTSLIDSANSSLICDYHGNCLCPDDVLTFVCRVSGLGAAATVWTGSILFNCPNSANEVILRHRRFEDIDGVNGVCNDGEVVAYSIEATNNSYISRLNVTVSPEMKNGDVQCIQEGPGTNSTSVGACPLKLTFSSEPPDDIHFSDISPNQFTIQWSPPANNCPVANYGIATTDCGVCPNTTSGTSITCTNLTIEGQLCSIVIQTRACESRSYSDSGTANLTIELKVSSAPEITAEWANQFASIITSFNTTEQFNISEGIDGSACNYTILYSESASQVLERILCGSVTISASKCTTGQCIHTFDIPSTCSNITRIAVTVFGTSILGNSPMSVLEINKTVTHDHNQITPDSLPITLYSIVGGSSFAGILFLLMVIITLAFFLKKLYKSVQSNSPGQVIYLETHTESIAMNDETGSMDIYTDLPVLNEDEEADESREVTEDFAIYENRYNEIDKTLNLDNLLIQIRREVTPKWYKFGLAVGINQETLDEFANFPPEECIVELSDLWLRTSESTLTWRDVADALKKTGCYRLAERILKVYKTGILPADQEAAEVDNMSVEQSSMTSRDQDSTNESSQSDRPHLPPKTYQ